MAKEKRKYYQIQIGNEWITCSKAALLPKSWLEYELRDGTTGMKRPGTWREKPEKET